MSTGGGTGLGFAIAKELALLGANVVIAARRLELLEEAAATINNLVAQQEGAKGGKVSDFSRASELHSGGYFGIEGSLFSPRVWLNSFRGIWGGRWRLSSATCAARRT